MTFTASVSAAYRAPTGAVEFWDGSTFLGAATLVTVDGGTTAVFTTSAFASGTHDIRAVYDGDSNDLSSASDYLGLLIA